MNQLLEHYLSEIEQYLIDITPSDRSQIIQENYKNILQMQENYPSKSLKEILHDLGPAQKVANHYRLERGLQTFRSKKRNYLKWVSITIMGSFATFFIFVGVLIWKFTPLAKFDEDNKRIVLLGGMIDINGMSGKIKVFDQYQFVENAYSNQFEGSMELGNDIIETVVSFNTGIFTIATSQGRTLSWDCKLESAPTEDIISLNESSLLLSFNKAGQGSCALEIPADSTLTLNGKEGRVEFLEPEFDLMAEIKNGSIIFNQGPEVEYNFDIKVKNGTQAQFESSVLPSAYEVKLYLENGNVERSYGP